MTQQTDKAFPVSWEELHRTSKALAWRLLELGPFDGLVAVTRGGLVPAAIVARELEIRLIDTACMARLIMARSAARSASLKRPVWPVTAVAG